MVILLVTLALVLLGLVMVYSSSMVKAISSGDDATYYVVRQAIYAVIGFVACVLIWKMPVMGLLRVEKTQWILCGLCWAFLVATFLFGTGDESWGAKRWLVIGSYSLQPSEFVKIGLVIIFSYLYDEFRRGQVTLKDFGVKALVMVVVPLVFLYGTQSDLGTTMVIVVALMAVLWLGGCPAIVFGIIIVLGVAVVAVAVLATPYRLSRLLIYLNPWNDGMDGLGDGWQIINSFWAFAEGGIFGLGLGNSYEKYSYLPMAETDFIYAIIGEELGLVGAVAVLALFVVLLIAGMRVAQRAQDSFSSLVAGGMTVMLIFQAFLNMGCAVGVFPTTGKPLPFISSGGSSLIASLMMIGFILSVCDEGPVRSEYDRRRDDLRVVRAVSGRSSANGDFSARRGSGYRFEEPLRRSPWRQSPTLYRR